MRILLPVPAFIYPVSAHAQRQYRWRAILPDWVKFAILARLAANPRARLAYPGDASIDVTYYGLDLRLTTTPASLRGAATITLKSTAANSDQFFSGSELNHGHHRRGLAGRFGKSR